MSGEGARTMPYSHRGEFHDSEATTSKLEDEDFSEASKSRVRSKLSSLLICELRKDLFAKTQTNQTHLRYLQTLLSFILLLHRQVMIRRDPVVMQTPTERGQ